MEVRSAIILLLAVFACAGSPADLRNMEARAHPGDDGSTIMERFAPPEGFARVNSDTGSFGAWLQHFPLKPAGSVVHLYNGELRSSQDVHAAVLDLSVGHRDLQQCADAVMRLRAEYLFASGRQDEIAFHFTNGFLAEWRRWRNGERIEVSGNDCRWLHRAEPNASHTELLRFLEIVFTYAGTLSLSDELADQTPSDLSAADIQAGDVFIQGGSPGHAIIVVDVARHPDGRIAFMMAQSYMPAQEVHVLKDPADPAQGPWYQLEARDMLYTPEWTFHWGDRRRFTDP